VNRVVLDTDVASLSFKRQLPPGLLAELIGREPAVAFVTAGELTKWAFRRQWGAVRQRRMDQWLSRVPVLHSTDDITAIWGEISASAEQRGRPRPQNDTWVGCLDARAARSAPISQELALNFLAQHVLGLPSHR
jgi:toxin FitB